MHIAPPYLNKLVEKREKEYHNAQEKRLKKEKDLEFAIEYEKLCKERYEEAKANAEKEFKKEG